MSQIHLNNVLFPAAKKKKRKTLVTLFFCYPVEIKSGKTINQDFFKNLVYWEKLTGSQTGAIIYGGNTYQKRSSGIDIIPWYSLSEIELV